MSLELAEQHLAKEVVIAIRVARPVEWDDEEVHVVEGLEHPGRPAPFQHRVAKRTVHRVEDGRSHQKRALVLVQARKALGPEVIGEIPVVARKAGVSPVPNRERGQIKARRPPFGAIEQVGNLVVAELDPRSSQQGVRLAAAESDQVGPDLEQTPLRTDRGDRKPERAAPRERKRGMRRNVLREDAEDLGRRRRGQPRCVVENQDER